MNFANQILDLLNRRLDGTPVPPVRALHLPSTLAPSDSKDAEFCALELADGSLGLSYVLLDDTLTQLGALDRLALAGADPFAIARAFAVGAGVRRTLGFAAVNALSRHWFDRVGYVPPKTGNSIGLLDPQPGDHIGMIGLFRGLTGQILATGARLTVVELKPELAGERDGYRVTLDASELAGCNKILSTSTILLNDTLDRMLDFGHHAERFAMIGPGAGCLPEPLFARGVTLLGGAWIDDRDGFLAALARGEPWGRFTRKFAIQRESYQALNFPPGSPRARGVG
ncbi:MAG: Rossmann-like domain-containing protein [Thiotrichales bacterium]